MNEFSKKRVLIFSTAYYPFVGGAEVSIKEITDRLSKDFEFDLITTRLDLKSPNKERVGNVNVYRIGGKNKTLNKILIPFRGASFALTLRRKYKYNSFWAVMVSYASGAAFFSNFLGSYVGLKKVPIILNLQEGDSENHLKYGWLGLIKLSWKLALRNTTMLTALSNFLINRAKDNGYKGLSVLVPNGVDLEVFTQAVPEEKKLEVAFKLGKKTGDVYLTTTSRLTHKNATDDIIRALSFLPENIHLLVIGIGEEGQKLQKLVLSLGLEKRVKFLGFIKHRELPLYLSISDIFIRPSRSEGFGNSFIEAMAASVPVIATPVGGIPDFLDDKETGVFCSPDNPKSISEAVNLILNNNEIRERIIQKAKERVVQNYSWDKVSNIMKNEVFDKVGNI
jgi:glycosyltransferase involved in cell wall biosynthesis